MLLYFVITLLSSLFFYVEAFKSGMNPRLWALCGIILGPALLPMFSIQRHIAWRKDAGFNNLYWQA